ncbi:MAG TPA: CoA transferase [Candidatus Dormibacteraeota bacterium]|nr:CoA transferase [Candidatus Dormibacteraeota bacterium]
MNALEGIRVLDAATLFAGPLAATMLADLGAEVIKIEHPKGDPVRTHGYQKDGVPLWWKLISRNKRTVTLDLSHAEGQRLLRGLVRKSDVLVESFRPGTLERWNLGPDVLHQDNPGLVLTRVTGFGQFGPYRSRPGFGTLAEAMSGFAAMTGEPDGPPTLPPFGLADGIAGLATAIAILAALRAKDHLGRGQVIDTALIEPILTILGPQPTWYDQLGIVQERRGNRSVNNAPRNVYRTKDGRWVAISTSAQNVAERVMRLVGHPEVIQETWFASGAERAKHTDELDRMVGSWIGERSFDEVLAAFEKAEAAVAPIYDIRHIVEDPQFQALHSLIEVEDPELGHLKMQNVMFRLSETPGRVLWAGRRKGEDNAEVYGNLLGLDSACLRELAEKGVI